MPDRWRLRAAALGAAALFPWSGCAEQPVDPVHPLEGLGLEPIVSSNHLPLIDATGMAIVSPDRICVFDNYEIQIVCGDRAWRDTVRMGHRGSGPGELGSYGIPVPGEDGLLGFLDLGNFRISTYSADFAFRHSVRFTMFPMPIGPITSDLVLPLEVPTPFASSRIVWFDLETGSLVRELTFDDHYRALGTDTVHFGGVTMTPAGDFVGRLNPGRRIGWYNRDGEFVGEVDVRRFGPVSPSDSEVQRFVNALTPWRPPRPDQIEAYRDRTANPFRDMAVDTEDRLWLATRRPSAVGTYIDVFQRTEYLGSIEIPGTVLNMQIVDSMLVAMIEELEPDAMGLYPRRLDWYRIVER